MQQITNSEFLSALFPNKPAGSCIWINDHEGDPAEYQSKGRGGQFWRGNYVNDPDECDADFRERNGYYCPALLQKIDRRVRRQIDYAISLNVVVLDDANNIDFDPTYLLETSAGNHQVGLKLADPILDRAMGSRLMEELVNQKRVANDKNGNNVVRYARLPYGSNGKCDPPYRNRLKVWNPDRAFTLQEVCNLLGLNFEYIIGAPVLPHNAPIAATPLSGALKNLPASDWTVNEYAMADLSVWVPDLFPQAKESNGNYRISSQFLGRDLQEDISIHRDGIVDFGVSDQGDKRGGRRTPIELVAEHLFGDIKDAINAEKWLRDKLGMAPIDLEINDEQLALIRAGTEHTIALAFRQKNIDHLKFNVTTKKWLLWDGKCWVVDELNKAMYECRQLATRLSSAKTAQKHSFFKGVELIARSDPAFAISNSAFDVDNYLFNTPDGVIDLRNVITRPHDAALLLSKVALVGTANDYGDRFPQFLREITCGDQQIAVFLQVALGACLSGAIESHWIMFWIGTGRNGKNTLGDAIMNILGDYARKIPARILMNNKNEGHPTEIAQLWGARLAVGSEVEQSSFWSESKLNELTGDQTIAGRFMGCDWFNFPKTWKFLIYGNHRPRLNSITPAVKARIKMVPFKADFSEKGDPDLADKLKQEYPNILKWLVDGHRMWLDAGKKLPPCAAIDAEIDDYLESQATIENWIDQRLLTPSDSKFNPDTWCNATQLYNDYRDWKNDRGEQPTSQTTWGDLMKKHFLAKRGGGGMRYQTVILERAYPENENQAKNQAATEYQRRRP